jgi:hypothetical protein
MNNKTNGKTVVEMDPQSRAAANQALQSNVTSFMLQAGDKITVAINRLPGNETAIEEYPVPENEIIPVGMDMAGIGQIGVPTINSFFPTAGLVGTQVNVIGFNLSSVTQVFFNGTPAAFARNADGTLLAIVPLAATDGPIMVQSLFGSSSSSAIFDVLPNIILPEFTVVNFSPAQGPQGTKVFIEGRGFAGVQRVAFGNINGIGDTPASFTVLSDTLIRATVPPVTNLSQLGFKVIKVKKGQLLVNATTYFNVTFI